MRLPVLATAVVAALSATPALARSHGLSCAGQPFNIDGARELTLPLNTATQPITLRARFDISAESYTIESVTGATVVPVGRVPFGGFNEHGPVVRGNWRGGEPKCFQSGSPQPPRPAR